MQSIKCYVDGKELYLPLTVKLRVRKDGSHNGCTMPRRIAVHGPNDLHAHQAPSSNIQVMYVCTICTMHAGHNVTGRYSVCMQVAAEIQKAAASSVKPQTASQTPMVCVRRMTFARRHEGSHSMFAHSKVLSVGSTGA